MWSILDDLGRAFGLSKKRATKSKSDSRLRAQQAVECQDMRYTMCQDIRYSSPF
jgi:hypothetical protein